MNIGLLIGCNCFIVFVLLKVVLNEGDGFFVVRFYYGWMVSGLLYFVIVLIMNKVIVSRIIVRVIENVKEIIIFELFL